MARPVRIEFPNAIYLVSSQSEGSAPVFKTNKDRESFLNIIQQVCQRYNWKCHAFSLVKNSYCLVVETPDANLSRGMRQLNGVYTQHYNAMHEHNGNVFQGRFKAVLLEKDAYLARTAREVMMKPLLDKTTKNLEKYQWSSYAACIGLEKGPQWLHTDLVLSDFGKRKPTQEKKLKEFCAQVSKDGSVFDERKQQIFLGSDDFIKKMKGILAKNLSPKTQKAKINKIKPISRFTQKTKDRNTAIYDAYLSGDYTMKTIADHFNIHHATVSRIIKKVEDVVSV